MVKAPQFQGSFLHPRYWGIWLGCALLWLISWLPYSVLMRLGDGIGLLLLKLLKSRAKVARRNLELCFPEQTAAERQDLLRANFKESGRALFDTIIGWWWPAWRLKRFGVLKGFEHVQAARSAGKGVLLLASHMLHLEAAGRIFGFTLPSVGFYRPNNNPLMDWLQYRGRIKANKYMIGKREVKALLQALDDGEVCFYLPDQDYGRKTAEFVPFFAVEQTATTTGTLLFANNANCQVIPVYTRRLPGNQGYEIECLPALDNFPSGDNAADVRRINAWVEQAVLRAPQQYMWLHRRFKTRPNPNDPGLY